ncbi:MAG TPA: DUF137 domain-containing protein, partial [Thermoprotei archaeon]|nr:DUF137 domain-containing protein [Thermoprotei archaeon]
SRTARTATVTIVDDVTRALNKMIEIAKELKTLEHDALVEIVKSFDNKRNLQRVLDYICKRLKDMYYS